MKCDSLSVRFLLSLYPHFSHDNALAKGLSNMSIHRACAEASIDPLSDKITALHVACFKPHKAFKSHGKLCAVGIYFQHSAGLSGLLLKANAFVRHNTKVIPLPCVEEVKA